MKNDLSFLDNLLGGRTQEEMREDSRLKYQKTPENMSNWLFNLLKSPTMHTMLKIPNTFIIQLSSEDFSALVSEQDKVGNLAKLNFTLESKLGNFCEGKPLFMKTGVFSNKFDFQNCYCGLDRSNLGEKLNEMYHMSMLVGAHESSEVVFREYIEDVEDHKTIYNGLPLRTEYRVFYDFDKKEVLGTSNYWHSEMMTEDKLKEDYGNYLHEEEMLNIHYNQHKHYVASEVAKLMDGVEGLKGKWSVDVMENGEDFWLIDMATMDKSALVEYMEEVYVD